MEPFYPKAYFQRVEVPVEPATVFVLMPFRKELLGVFDTISNALSQLSPAMKVVRADEPTAGGVIIADILAGIARADFIIADLTEQNTNVFYELGICHTVKSDVVLLSQKPEELPFDLRHLRCISYEASPSGLYALSSKLRASFREILESRNRKKNAEQLKNSSCVGAVRVSDWFAARMDILRAVAEWTEFRCNDPASHLSAIGRAAATLREFGGGIYTLDAGGTILGSFPLDIRGQNYAHREYFRLCSSRRTGVVSNTLDSANRDHMIVVVAVPRFDANGAFLGILDAVIDIDNSPLNKIMGPVGLEQSADLQVHLLLVDQRCVVVGADTPGLAGKNIGGNPLIRRLSEANLSEKGIYIYDQQAAAAFPVDNTPFMLVAISGQLSL